VFGIPHEDWGEEIKAVVQPAPGAEPGPGLTADLLAYLAERVAKFKLPRTIDYVAELPRDPNGKLYKRRLRDPYWTGRTPGGRAGRRRPVQPADRPAAPQSHPPTVTMEH
jgi:long-chain acyl-CoA synthetase